MATPRERLDELGIDLPDAPEPAAAYAPWQRTGDTVFTAGQLPVQDGVLTATGLVGEDLTADDAEELARVAAINLLAVAEAAAGDLADVRAVKLTVFVASAPGFTEQHLVANGASLLLADVLGDAGLHARSAVGVPSLPLNSPVEVEAIFAVTEGRGS